MRRLIFAKGIIGVITTAALVFGMPQSAHAEGISITSVSISVVTDDPSDLSFSGDTWTLSFCSKSKTAKKSYIQVKSGQKWTKLKKVSKTKTAQDIAQCQETYPFLTEFTYTETKAGNKKYRINMPGKSGYKLNFTVAKDSASSAGGGTTIDNSASKLEGCYFKGKKLAGSVYFSTTQSGSDFTIYESGSSIGSNLGVYLYPSNWTGVNPRTIATCGQWITASSSSSLDADFIVYRTSSPASADFVINYVPFAWNAGLN